MITLWNVLTKEAHRSLAASVAEKLAVKLKGKGRLEIYKSLDNSEKTKQPPAKAGGCLVSLTTNKAG